MVPRHMQKSLITEIYSPLGTKIQAVCLLGLFLLLTACGDLGTETSVARVQKGTSLIFAAYGREYKTVAIKVDGDYAIWETRWGKHTISTQKLYRGLITVSADYNQTSLYNEFEASDLKPLFPLAVGREVNFKGIHHSGEGGPAPFWAHVIIQGKEIIEIGTREYRVFIIQVTMETVHPEGTKITSKTVWLSPELGVSLKAIYHFGGTVVKGEVVEVNSADEPAGVGQRTPDGIGTTLIS